MVVVMVVRLCAEPVVIVVMVVQEVLSLVVHHPRLVSQVRGGSMVAMLRLLLKNNSHSYIL